MERWAGFMVFGDDVFYVQANTYSLAVKRAYDHAGRVARERTSSVLCAAHQARAVGGKSKDCVIKFHDRAAPFHHVGQNSHLANERKDCLLGSGRGALAGEVCTQGSLTIDTYALWNEETLIDFKVFFSRY
jgi:hypothetical protein